MEECIFTFHLLPVRFVLLNFCYIFWKVIVLPTIIGIGIDFGSTLNLNRVNDLFIILVCAKPI